MPLLHHPYPGRTHAILSAQVLLAEGDSVRLIDFGEAHVYPAAPDGGADRSAPLKKDSGTTQYAAPEVIAWSAREPDSRGYDGFAADAWSLGVLLFAMLVGALPLGEASRDDPAFVALAQAHAKGASATRALCAARQLPCKLPAPAVALLDALLCIDPGRRATIDEVRRSRDGAERAHRGSLLAPLQGRSTSCFLPSQVRRHAFLAERRPSLMDMVGGFFTPAPAAAAAAPVAA